MESEKTGLKDAMCAAVDIKEKMKQLYAESATKCSDELGNETFRMLENMERDQIERLRQIYADLMKGESDVDSCRFYDFDTNDRSAVLRRISRERKLVSKACLNDIAAIEGGLDLENKSIDFFSGLLKKASNVVEREFLNHLIAEERSHYIMLADLKFYYIDPEHWFMEKNRTGLDGAGGAA
jgi:rubrerythrin